jgi:hypothetical protein
MARQRFNSINTFMAAPRGRTVDRTELSREVASVSAQHQQVEALRHCPRCGAEHFTQEAARSRPGLR